MIFQWSPVVMYRIVSPSMQPTILVNDVVLINRWIAHEDIEVGDIIAFRTTLLDQREVVVVHYVDEVVEENGMTYFRTIAQNQTEPDRWIIASNEVIGKYVVKISGIGRLLEFFNSTFGQIVLVLNFLIILLWIYMDTPASGGHHAS